MRGKFDQEKTREEVEGGIRDARVIYIQMNPDGTIFPHNRANEAIMRIPTSPVRGRDNESGGGKQASRLTTQNRMNNCFPDVTRPDGVLEGALRTALATGGVLAHWVTT